jgi:hypothetical protein
VAVGVVVALLSGVALEKEVNGYTASDFLRTLIEAVPYTSHKVLTDNGMQFCHAHATAQVRQPATACTCSRSAARTISSGRLTVSMMKEERGGTGPQNLSRAGPKELSYSAVAIGAHDN